MGRSVYWNSQDVRDLVEPLEPLEIIYDKAIRHAVDKHLLTSFHWAVPLHSCPSCKTAHGDLIQCSQALSCRIFFVNSEQSLGSLGPFQVYDPVG